VGRRSGVPVSDSLLNDEINGALFEVAQMASWPWLERVAAISIDGDGSGVVGDGVTGGGTSADPLSNNNLDAFPLPTDYRKVVSVAHDGSPVLPVSTADADAGFVSSGYYIDTQNLALVLIGGSGLEGDLAFRYVAHETVLSADTDTAKMPSNYDDVIVLLASANILEGRNKETTRAGAYRKRAVRRLRDMRKHSDPRKAGSRHHRVSTSAPF